MSRAGRARRLVAWPHRAPRARVLLVTNMWPGDPDRPVYGVFIKRQVDSLIRSGLACDVLYVRGHRSPAAYALAALRLALANLRPRRYDVVHALCGEALPVARAYVRAPLVVTFIGSDLHGKPDPAGGMAWSWRLRRALLRNAARLTAATITVSAGLERRLPRSVRARNSIISTGVDMDRFAPAPADAARRVLGWELGERTVLFAADPARPEKRYALAEAAVSRAARLLPDVRLRVAAQDVPPERMPVLMNAADCLLLTSSSEGSPNVVKEALACNLPVVATDVGDVRQLLDGVQPSFVCDDSPEALGDGVVACVGERRRSDGRDAPSALSEADVAAHVLALYDRVGAGDLMVGRGGD
jgi:glycosyltransferase involved in cell wall biosynthesis